jgi:hypothetical protein
MLYFFIDALRKLGIVPNDEAPINITPVQDISRLIAPDQDTASAHATNTALPNTNDRKKKRKALEAQLEDIEDEQRIFELEQRKRRVQRELAQFEEDE